MKNLTRQNTDKKKILKQKDRISTLQELLVYYQEITETIREPFIILDKNLRVVTANNSFYQTFKALKKDTEKKSIYQLGNNQWDTPELRRLLENILPKKRILSDYEITHNFPTLGHKTMLLNARQVDHKQLILLAIQDITQQSQLQRDSSEMTKGLIRQHDKIKSLSDAKDEFILMASHQLRTPATAVKQYIGMLAQGFGGKLTKMQKGMLSTAYESNERQLHIIEDLLKVARIDEGKVHLVKSQYDLTKQIGEVVRDQFDTFEVRRQSIIFNKPSKKVIAYADKKLMRMVLENLLENAGKYSYEGGKITIGLKQSNKLNTVSVMDKGVGVRKKDLEKLFLRFSRIDNPLSVSVEGTGLGLFWVKKILDLHGGSMQVKSRINYGSTFTISFPVLPSK
ncbi:PAS domain-containing sensor histidine kinase [Candidatus Saccharibacteria bacterium]|nr:PAS domain-containing sensor histidine kinase [Candidatus Saccharibacteria bacterium]